MILIIGRANASDFDEMSWAIKSSQQNTEKSTFHPLVA